jgi:alkylation response protein AidB-like acyl-CoA dehydrogenase
MRFGLSEDQTLLDATVRRLLTDQVPLDAVRAYADGGDDQALWTTLCELGLGGLLVPEERRWPWAGRTRRRGDRGGSGLSRDPGALLGYGGALSPGPCAAAGLSNEPWPGKRAWAPWWKAAFA